ncbi:Rho GTPase-activating protein 20 [Triplophysa tibetana]|uniref:Rho GTPase-activating protein 20 n=1 Tax=Triplophysa tibetana TaxID=1572043 RepID=A0A5A9P414_9TELE|nr:Rho GTPase-activating protein 20 [Triplophysa tibetana]
MFCPPAHSRLQQGSKADPSAPEKDNILLENKQTLEIKDKELETSQHQLETLRNERQKVKLQLDEQKNKFTHQEKRLQEHKQQQQQYEAEEKQREIEEKNKLMSEKETLLENTVKELETSKHQLETMRNELQEVKLQLDEQKNKFTYQEKLLQEHKQQQQQYELNEKCKRLEDTEKVFTVRDTQIKDLEKRKETALEEKDRLLHNSNDKLKQTTTEGEEKQREIEAKNKLMSEKETLLENTVKELETSKHQLETMRNELQEVKLELDEQKNEFTHQEKLLQEHKKQQQQYVSGETASVFVSGSELRLVLLGSAGYEKSAAGNIILNREKNQTETSAETQQSEIRQEEVYGKQVTVVETPDWFCSGLSMEEVRQDVRRCIRLSAPGPHAFLLVIPVHRSTGVKKDVLEKMEEIFGERCWSNTIILFTVTDKEQEKNIEDFVQSENQKVQSLVEKCGNRFHCLNLHRSEDGSQVSELLGKIEKMMEENTERSYSSEIYLEVESQIRAMERNIIRDREERKEREEREINERIENEVQNSLRKIERVIEEHDGDIKQLNERTGELKRQIREERDEEKKKELMRELEKEVRNRTELKREIDQLKDQREREKSEMEEKHRQEIEKIKQEYGEIRADNNLMKVILPKLQRNILDSRLHPGRGSRGGNLHPVSNLLARSAPDGKTPRKPTLGPTIPATPLSGRYETVPASSQSRALLRAWHPHSTGLCSATRPHVLARRKVEHTLQPLPLSNQQFMQLFRQAGLFKSKRRRSLIDWALRRGHLNQSDDNVEPHNASQKLFGQSLSSICPDGNLPKPITDLLYLLFCEGPETCGIFRRSANAKSCRILKERMNSGKSISPHEESVFVSASLITEFLRELPGGVLRCDLYEEWIEVLQIEEEQHKLYQIRSLFAQLPEENFTLLCHLFGVLHRIHSHSHVNLMTASNLALCIAPNMLWRSSKVSPELEGKSTLQVAELIQFLIENTPAVFGDDLESLFTSRIISEQETRDSADGPYLQHSSSEDTDQDFIVSSPLSPEVHPLFLPLAALSFKEKRRMQPFHVDAPASQGTYSCGTLDSISSQSSASMYTLGIGKLSQTRDRCLSEPVMYFATPQSQMLVHTPVIRQSSYDAAVIDNRTEQSQTSVGLSPEQQVHNSATGPRRRRYTFWKSPQIPSRFKHPAQKLASMSSLSSATTSSLSSLDSTLSLSSADLIPSPQHTQSQPFLFGAAARLQPVTPEMSRKRWTNVFTYDEEEKVDMWDQDLEMDKKERKFEEPPHAERVESEDSMKSIIMEVKAVQRQCTSDRQLLAEYGGLDTNALKSSDAHKPEHDVDSQAVSREPCCTQTLPMAKQIDNEMQESKLKQTPLGAPQIITKKDNSESQLRCLNVRSVMHASGVQKVSRMKITFFPSARKVMLKHSKVRDQTSKSVTMETEQNEKPGFTEQKEAKWGESLEVTIPQTLFYGLDVPLVLCSETSQQTSIQVNASMPSFEDVGVRDAGVDVSMISGNSGLGNGVCGFPDKNTVRNLECVTCDKVISCVNATDAPHNPGSIIENAQPAVSISSGSGIIRSISIFHGNANQGTLPPKPASKSAGTFRRTICIKLPVNVRNRGAVQNKL